MNVLLSLVLQITLAGSALAATGSSAQGTTAQEQQWLDTIHNYKGGAQDFYQLLSAYARLETFYRRQQRTDALISLLEQQLKTQAYLLHDNIAFSRDYLRWQLIFAYNASGNKAHALTLCMSFFKVEPDSPFFPLVYSEAISIIRDRSGDPEAIRFVESGLKDGNPLMKLNSARYLITVFAGSRYLEVAELYKENLLSVFHVKQAEHIAVAAKSDDYKDLARNLDDLAHLAQNTNSNFAPLVSEPKSWADIKKHGLIPYMIGEEQISILRIVAGCYEKAGLPRDANRIYEEMRSIYLGEIPLKGKIIAYGFGDPHLEDTLHELDRKIRELTIAPRNNAQ